MLISDELVNTESGPARVDSFFAKIAGIAARRKSLRNQIMLLYFLMALATILILSAIIVENQSELVMLLFKAEAREITTEIRHRLKGTFPDRPGGGDRVAEALREFSVKEFTLLRSDGSQIFPSSNNPVPPDLARRIGELTSESVLFNSTSNIVIDRSSMNISFLAALEPGEGPLFLHGILPLTSMKARMNQVYAQLVLAMAWIVLFNIVFGIYLYRLIFKRVDVLKAASSTMAAGNLKARARWEATRDDELDDLGTAFNHMADEIEQKVQVITTLNKEMNQELRIGSSVQQTLLPGKNDFGDLNPAIHFQPLREVSGDFYTFLPNGPAGHRVVFFGDATGHGVSAALVTAVAAFSLREVFSQTINPARALGLLNNLLCDRLKSDFCCTGIMLTLAPSGRIHYASGGHPPALWLRPSTGQVTDLMATGPVIGMVEDFDFPGKSIPASKGDRFIIYSDGVNEAANLEGEQFGVDRIKQIAVACAQQPAEEFVRILSAELEAFKHKHRDDVTIVAFDVP